MQYLFRDAADGGLVDSRSLPPSEELKFVYARVVESANSRINDNQVRCTAISAVTAAAFCKHDKLLSS